MKTIEEQRDLVEGLQQEADDFVVVSCEDHYDRQKLLARLEDAQNDLADMEEGVDTEFDA